MTTQTVHEVSIEQAAPTSQRQLRRRRHPYWLGASLAVVAIHVLSLLVGLIVLLHENAHLWFFGDDWDFLALRGLHHPTLSIWQPHNEHWSTIPILWYRLLFTLFGLHYFPYILTVIVAHLVLAHLIWRTCLREGVDPWVSTTFAALFVFLGSGAENLTWDFQITFIASVVFGYLALEVARRQESIAVDAAISLFLLCALMCSTIGDSMVLAVGVFLVITRGWRGGLRPLFVPLACYALWYGLIGHQAVRMDHVGLTTLLSAPGFVWSGIEAALGSTFGLSAAGAALLVGLLGWTAYDFPQLYRSHPAVLGLGLGTGSFYFLAALGRSVIGTSAASRYVYVAMALLIPLIATLISLIKRPAFDIRAPVIAVLLFVIVANLGALRTFTRSRVALVEPDKEQVLTTASLVARGVPSLVPNPVSLSPNLTTKDMVAFVRSGLLNVVPVSNSERLLDEASMEVSTTSYPLFSRALKIVGYGRVTWNPASHGCTAVQATGAPYPQVAFATPRPGGSIAISGAGDAVINVAVVKGNMVDPTAPITLSSRGRAYLNSALPTGSLVLTLPPGGTTLFCSP